MTILTKQEMIDILGKLAVQGNTYTCEAQFQFDLAYALRKYFEKKSWDTTYILSIRKVAVARQNTLI